MVRWFRTFYICLFAFIFHSPFICEEKINGSERRHQFPTGNFLCTNVLHRGRTKINGRITKLYGECRYCNLSMKMCENYNRHWQMRRRFFSSFFGVANNFNGFLCESNITFFLGPVFFLVCLPFVNWILMVRNLQIRISAIVIANEIRLMLVTFSYWKITWNFLLFLEYRVLLPPSDGTAYWIVVAQFNAMGWFYIPLITVGKE